MRKRRIRPDRRARILWPSGVTTSKFPPTITLVTVPFISTRSSRLKGSSWGHDRQRYTSSRRLRPCVSLTWPQCDGGAGLVELVLPLGLFHLLLVLDLPGRRALLEVL